MLDYLLKPVDAAVLTKLLLHCAEQLQAAGVEEPSAALSEGDRIRQIKRYISAHLEDDLSLKVIAQQMFLSASYLSALFKKRTGSTISAYVEEQRIEKARALLLNRDASISAIAQRVGYPDQAYFSRVFSRRVGCSPKAFQRSKGACASSKSEPPADDEEPPPARLRA